MSGVRVGIRRGERKRRGVASEPRGHRARWAVEPAREATLPCLGRGGQHACLARVILAGSCRVGPAHLSRYIVIPQKNIVDKVISFIVIF